MNIDGFWKRWKLLNVERHVSGAVHVTEHTYEDRDGRSLWSSGKGSTESAADIGAEAEAIERAFLLHLSDEPTRAVKVDDLCRLYPEDRVLQVASRSGITALESVDLAGGPYPAALANPYYKNCASPAEHMLARYASSTGCAVGRSRLDAEESSHAEAVERGSVGSFMEAVGRGRIVPPAIVTPPELAQSRVCRAEAYGVRPIASEWHVYIAGCGRDCARHGSFPVGTAAARTPARALAEASMEYAQGAILHSFNASERRLPRWPMEKPLASHRELLECLKINPWQLASFKLTGPLDNARVADADPATTVCGLKLSRTARLAGDLWWSQLIYPFASRRYLALEGVPAIL